MLSKFRRRIKFRSLLGCLVACFMSALLVTSLIALPTVDDDMYDVRHQHADNSIPSNSQRSSRHVPSRLSRRKQSGQKLNLTHTPDGIFRHESASVKRFSGLNDSNLHAEIVALNRHEVFAFYRQDVDMASKRVNDVSLQYNQQLIDITKNSNTTATKSLSTTNVANTSVSNTSNKLFEKWKQWDQYTSPLCHGKLHYFKLFAILSGAILNHDRCRGAKSAGGETVHTVMNQSELDEYYTEFTDCFELPSCVNGRPTVRFSGARNPLNLWIAGLNVNGTDNASTSVDHVENIFTIILTRYDYANMYFVVNDWYNVYLMTRLFDRAPETSRVILFDAHPRGLLDDSWSILFGGAPTLQLSRVAPGRTLFAGDLVWSLTGAGPMSAPTEYTYLPPFLEDFRRFVLTRHGLSNPNDERRLNCSNVSVLFIWRHDYVAHPRNMNGTIQRKIANEKELIETLIARHSDKYTVRGIQLDLLPVVDQLKLVSQTDILVGMHGAGLTHVLFMPKHGALIELQPMEAKENTHFIDLALWRNMLYYRWQNTNKKDQVSEHLTRIPVEVIERLVNTSLDDMCAVNTTGHRITAFSYHEALKREQRNRARWQSSINGSFKLMPPWQRRHQGTSETDPRGRPLEATTPMMTSSWQQQREAHNKWLIGIGVTPHNNSSRQLVGVDQQKLNGIS